jgi:uncharacterized membrane protein YgdD (TMEM256/DUF423 family)
MSRGWAVLGAVSGAIAVAAGAFGAHAMKASLGADALAIWEVGARYQMYHALALLALGCATRSLRSSALRAGGWLFVVGTVLFSGSLYLLAATGVRAFGAVTPVGGVALIAGWLCVAWGVVRSR